MEEGDGKRKEDEEEELEALHLPICQKILAHVGCFGRVISHTNSNGTYEKL